jgi:hypothetical protein
VSNDRQDNQIDLILVPQGLEYRAIARGLNRINLPKPKILPVPMGTRSLQNFLEEWQNRQFFRNNSFQKILLMGLCGSLSSQYRVGDAVIYQDCLYASETKLEKCDRQLTQYLERILSDRAKTVKGLTSDRLIWAAEEKKRLGKLDDADVVDMEGYIALKTIKAIFTEKIPQIAIVRVISDDCDRDIPNLEGAINAKGRLQPLSVATSFLQQPIAAIRLIRGSINGLRVLEKLTTEIFSG